MKQHFQAWYEQEVQNQITSWTAIPDVKIDARTVILKPKSANWLIGALDVPSQKSEIVMNGFRKAGLVDALKADGE